VLSGAQSVTFTYSAPTDESFDALLPLYERIRSRQYWTPAAVAASAAGCFASHGARRVLDVGCGPGKFCLVAGRAAPQLEFHGIDQRPRLVRLGKALSRILATPNVRFTCGDATHAEWTEYDGFYFFNPFAENLFDEVERFDDRPPFSERRYGTELLRAEHLLGRARIGTVVVTYHGLGGAIPSSYELVCDEPAGTDRLRTWIQRSNQQQTWAWLESDGVERVDRRDLHRVLTAMVGEGVMGNTQNRTPRLDS
jgi:SAM-dependent methyltransferase